MAGAYLDCIQAQQPIGPVSLAGASFGGVVAFEIATRLAAAGRAVALTMIDAPAPGFAPEAEQDDAAIVARAVHALFKVSVDADALRALDAGARARLVAAAAAQAGEPLDLGADLLGRLIDVWRANHRALTRYRPAAVYPGAVRFFRPTLLEPGNRLDHDHHWRQFVSGPLEVMIVPGDHTTMNQWPNTRSILLAVPAE
jgi:thioesterase domain-containing protein